MDNFIDVANSNLTCERSKRQCIVQKNSIHISITIVPPNKDISTSVTLCICVNTIALKCTLDSRTIMYNFTGTIYLTTVCNLYWPVVFRPRKQKMARETIWDTLQIRAFVNYKLEQLVLEKNLLEIYYGYQ